MRDDKKVYVCLRLSYASKTINHPSRPSVQELFIIQYSFNICGLACVDFVLPLLQFLLLLLLIMFRFNCIPGNCWSLRVGVGEV